MIDPIPLAEALYDENERFLDNLDSAWAKAALFFRTGNHRFGHLPQQEMCKSLVDVKETLEVFRKRFEAGNTLALLHAIKYCAEENMPLPTWLSLEFSSRLSKFLSPGGPISLDEIFFSKDLPHAGKRAITVRRDWDVGIALCHAVWNVAEHHVSLDAALESVLSDGNYGVEKTKARELVLMIDKNNQETLGKKKHPGLMKYFSRKK